LEHEGWLRTLRVAEPPQAVALSADIGSYPGGRSFGAANISIDVGRNMGVGFCFGVVLLMA
jgi:hypothetical protein